MDASKLFDIYPCRRLVVSELLYGYLVLDVDEELVHLRSEHLPTLVLNSRAWLRMRGQFRLGELHVKEAENFHPKALTYNRSIFNSVPGFLS